MCLDSCVIISEASASTLGCDHFVIASLTDLRPLLISLVEGLEVLDLDPVLQRGEVKVGQAVHRPPPGLVLVMDGGETAASTRREDAHSRRNRSHFQCESHMSRHARTKSHIE